MKTKKRKKKRSPADLRLEALEIRIGRLEELIRPLAHNTEDWARHAMRLVSDYKAIGDVKRLIGDLDLTMFAVFHSTQDLLALLKGGAVPSIVRRAPSAAPDEFRGRPGTSGR